MKTKYLAILLCAAFVLPGCNDSFLDRIPLDELTDETYWETEEHLILASECLRQLFERKKQECRYGIFGR